MNLQYSLIDSKDELISHKDSILELFSICFGKKLDPSIWDWAYLYNPMGSPIVSLCHAHNRLVGHYAVIPFDLEYMGQQLPACLSMTTMVDATCRKYGLFVEQAQQVYDRVKTLGFKIVFGFPNAKSAPGFCKRLGWELDEPDYVACVTMRQLASSAGFIRSLTDNTLAKIDIKNNDFIEWRLSKSSQIYKKNFSIIIKEFGSQEDIVYIESIIGGGNDDVKKFNILLDSSVDDLKEYSVFPYQFGYKILDAHFSGLKFKKDMLMSDVF